MKELEENILALEKKRSDYIMELGEIKYSKIRNAEIDNKYVEEISESILDIDKNIYSLNCEMSKIIRSKEKIYCPKCESEIKEKDKFCIDCGESLEQDEDISEKIGNCSYCRNPITSEHEFCNCCGQEVVEVEEFDIL